MPAAALLIEHLDQLYTVAGPSPRAGRRQNEIAPIADGAAACDADGCVLAAGTNAHVRAAVAIDGSTRLIDGRGRSLVPVTFLRTRR